MSPRATIPGADTDQVGGPPYGPPDVVDALLGIEDGTPLAALRALRPEVRAHTQGSYDALFDPAVSTGVTPEERFATALRVAALHAHEPLADHFRSRLAGAAPGGAAAADVEAGRTDALPARTAAMLVHAELLALRPAAATPDDHERLRAAGLDTAQIVTVSQLVSFVSFQARVLTGLALLAGVDRGVPGGSAGQVPVPEFPFTLAEVGWEPWLPPLEMADATDEQRAALPGFRADMPYFRLLALDPAVLVERTATDNGIFYTRGGAPRADRELAATTASRLNGCVFCASVHSRFAAHFGKRTEDVQRLLDEGLGADLGDERWNAVVNLAAKLSWTPSAAEPSDVARLRRAGLEDPEILDIVQATAFFAWANRLMQTIGGPVPPPA
ncbi:alkylhydroperoxidase domain protein [Streptomyces sp.]|uniref:alkylhydroperoxidase domain protein n=1 Tax=Streptomyces sp. TaxID=1931 RepID=UPI002F42E39B